MIWMTFIPPHPSPLPMGEGVFVCNNGFGEMGMFMIYDLYL